MPTDQLITHSRMESFKRCRKRHFWEYEVGIRRTLDAKALRMGSAYHAGLDVLKTAGTGDIQFNREPAVDAVRKYYMDIHAEMEEVGDEILYEEETVAVMVCSYWWLWKDSAIKVIESEREFRLPLRNPATGASSRTFELAGKIDGIVEMEDGRLAVQEHKLQADGIEPESDYWRRLQMDSQITLYLYAARELGYPVDVVLYDVARKPTIRPEQIPLLDDDGLKIVLDAEANRVVTKQGKPRQTGSAADGYYLQTRRMTPDEWVEKLGNDIGNRPGYYFARQEVPRLDQDVLDFMAEVWDIQKAMRDAQNNNAWYRTVGKDTCPYCPFFGLCSTKFNPETGLVPEGFSYLEFRHPELEKGVTNGSRTSPAKEAVSAEA